MSFLLSGIAPKWFWKPRGTFGLLRPWRFSCALGAPLGVGTSFTQICTVFYELYANLHSILRALRKFAPYFMSFTQICTVFDEVYANLHCILRALRKFAVYFTSFTQICMICIVFCELSVWFAAHFTSFTQICTVFYELYAIVFTRFTQICFKFRVSG